MILQKKYLRYILVMLPLIFVFTSLPLIFVFISRPDLHSVQDILPTRHSFILDYRKDNHKEIPPPIWSAKFARQQHHRHARRIQWWTPNDGSAHRKVSVPRSARRSALRSGKELLANSLGEVLPFYGNILPSVWLDHRPFDNTTRVKIAVVPDLVDAMLDLHECDVGRNTSNGEIVKDGYYNVCFSPTNDSGRRALRRHCKGKGTGRIYGFPAPGYELWSCSDNAIMEQMVAALILDYLIQQWDRFYSDHTNNLFFLKNQHPIQFVSIDHDGPALLGRANGSKNDYKSWVRLKMLLKYNMPTELRTNLKTVRLLGSKEDFVHKFNASMNGQLDGLTKVLVHPKKITPKTIGTSLTDDIWLRLNSLVDFYNITIED